MLVARLGVVVLATAAVAGSAAAEEGGECGAMHEDDESCSVLQTAFRSKKSGVLDVNQADGSSGSVVRFKLTTTKKSKAPHTVGMTNHAGQNIYDNSYGVTVHIGNQSFDVEVDTGSSDFAVLAIKPVDENGTVSEDCEVLTVGTACSNKPISDSYITGNWSGVYCGGALSSEYGTTPIEVSWGSLSAGPNATFVAMTKQYNMYPNCGPVGILGMGYKAILTDPGLTLWDWTLLYNNNELAGPPLADVFSIAACPVSDHEYKNDAGAMVLGGVDSSMYSGELAWTPIVDESYYCVEMTSITLTWDEQVASDLGITSPMPITILPAGGAGGNPNCSTIVDSGNDVGVSFYTPIYDELKGAILNFTLDIVQTVPSLPKPPKCDDEECHVKAIAQCVLLEDYGQYYPDLNIELSNGVMLTLTPMNYTVPNPWCEEHGLPGGRNFDAIGPLEPNTNLGQAVFEKYFIAFDRANKRVGFAPLKGCH